MKTFIFKLIEEAGKMALDYRSKLNELKVGEKSTKDFVTEADQAIEKLLRDRILEIYPEHAIYGEEYGSQGEGKNRWIIDPIDGTSSFVFGQPFFSISIAYEVDGQVITGAVHAPVLNETFYAEKGKGAELNGSPISVSKGRSMEQSIWGTGFACLRSGHEHNNIAYLSQVLPMVCDIRRLGSAALDLSYVAAGRLDGFWELNLNFYDIAAGKLIVEEAGGKLTDFSNHDLENCHEILASNGELHENMVHILKKV